MRILSLLTCVLLFFSCSKEVPSNKIELKPVSSFFPGNKTKVLVVGTFHFHYPGLDGHKVGDNDKIDVFVVNCPYK